VAEAPETFMRRTSTYILLFLLVIFSSVVCSQKSDKPRYLKALETRADFDLLKGEPLSNNFNGIECVKVVFDIKSKTIYYPESKLYKWHYRFVSEVLNDRDDLEQFNALNYSQSPQRKYILATFNYNTNTTNYFLQFSPSDNLSDEHIDMLCAKIAESTFCKKNFKLLLNTTILLRRKASISRNHPILSSDELFLSQSYQPIVEGKASGILLFLDADSIKKGKDYSSNILVLKGSSNDLPICKGLITDEFQTPLSHICLLTANRRTPCAAYKNVFSADSFRRYANKAVEINVTQKKVQIKPLSYYSATYTPPGRSIIPKLDTTRRAIVGLEKLSYKDKAGYGSKVCNLAEIKKIERREKTSFTPPKALGIPFCYYYRHLQRHGILRDIEILTGNKNISDSLASKQLQRIRKRITKAALDTALLNTVTRYCRSNFKSKKIRFRSSSSAEDESNFNGAGLYSSTSGIIRDSSKSIEKAIRKVWASLWNDRAFFERRYFGIDHKSSAMAILVHETYDDELVNGVCITQNLYRDYDFGFVINMQQGENEVVSPDNKLVCEQLISYMNSGSGLYNEAQAADWISYSSLSPGTSLLTTAELKDLTQKMEKIKRHFYDLLRIWPAEYKDFAMDVEFKIVSENKQRKIIIKQARPYTVKKN
jgi:pyruvate, water dikinase